MSNWLILPPSWTAGATASANFEASADTPASNLLAVQRSRLWASNTLTGIQITLDTQEAKPFNGVSLIGTNAYDGTWRVTANASTGSLFTSPSVDSGALTMRFPGDLSSFTRVDMLHRFSSVHTYRYIGIEINDASNPEGYFLAGVVMAGKVFEPNMGPDIGFRFGLDDNSEAIELLGGEDIVRPKTPKNVNSWSLPKQEFAEMIELLRINRIYASQIPVVVMWIPPIVNYQQEFFWYGYLQWNKGGAFSMVNATGSGQFDVAVAFSEL